MTLLVGLAIRSSIVLAAGLLLSAALHRHSAALRHRILAITLLSATVVMPFSLLGPEWIVTIPVRLVDTAPDAAHRAPDPLLAIAPRPDVVATGRTSRSYAPAASLIGSGETWTTLVIGLWLSGTLLMIGALIRSLISVRRVARRGSQVEDPEWLEILRSLSKAHGVNREVVILRSQAADLLGTWGIVKPEVLLPHESNRWTAERMRVVLSHELAHIRRCDWPVQIAAHVVRAVLWFNPLVWIVCRRLRFYAEQACDDDVLRAGIGARDYAAHLLDLARQCRHPGATWASAIPMAHPSTLETRITAMLNPLLDRRIPSRLIIAGVTAALLLVMLPAAALRARQAAPAPVTGTVYDATGAVIPGVKVTLVDATDTKWTATSTANGRFELPAVGPGKFVLEAALPGFRALRQEFELSDPRDWDRAVTLQIGTLSETVHISGNRMVLPKQPEASATAVDRIRVGGNIRVPKKEVHVAPIYPPTMIAAGLSGVVPIEAIIGVDGTVSSVRVLSAQVHPDFAMAASDAVRQWRFTPTLLNKVPVEVAMTVTLRFDLAD